MGKIIHYCELENEVDSVFPYLLPNAPLSARLKRAIQKTIVLYEGNPNARSFLRSSAAITFEKRRHARSVHWYIIHPFSIARIIWETLMSIVLIMALFEIPFCIAFHSELVFMSASVGLFNDIICLIDVVINFFTGYHEHKTKEIVLDPRRIALQYLKGYFCIDIISSLPLYEIIETVMSQMGYRENTYVYSAVNCISLLKIFRVPTIFKYTRHLLEIFDCPNAYMSISDLVILASIYFHWMSCTHYIVPLFTYGDDLFKGKDITSQSWVVQSDLFESSTLGFKYVNCLLRAVSNSVFLGYGHQAPRATEDVIVVIVNILLGVAFFTYLCVVLIHMISAPDASKTKYQEVMNQVQEYMTYKKLNNRLQRRMHVYYHHRLQKSFFREKAILATVSSHMREEILLHCCQHLVENVVFFIDVPKIIIHHIISYLKHEVFLPNDVVIQAGTPGDCMYFIASGTVSVFSPMGKEVAHLEDNGHFGEVALVMEDDARTANVVAIETCELYRLDRKDFENVITPFPELRRRIERIAAERVVKTFVLEDRQKQLLLSRDKHRNRGTIAY